MVSHRTRARRKRRFPLRAEVSAVYQVAKALADGIEDRPDIHVLMASIYLAPAAAPRPTKCSTRSAHPCPKTIKPLFYYYFAQAAFGTGKFDRYLELLGEAIKLKPEAYKSTLVDAYVQVADQYNQSGDLDRYIEFLAKAVSESPQTASLHLKLGNAYEEAQKFTDAVAQWRMVLDLEQDHPQRMKLLNLIDKYTSGTMLTVPPKNRDAKNPAEKIGRMHFLKPRPLVAIEN